MLDDTNGAARLPGAVRVEKSRLAALIDEQQRKFRESVVSEQTIVDVKKLLVRDVIGRKFSPNQSYQPGYHPPSVSPSSTKRSSDSGLLKESLLAASSGGVPERIFFTGTSSFLPFKV